MKNIQVKKRKTRLPLILGGVFLLAWAVAVIFTVGETSSRTHEKNQSATPALPDGPGGSGGRYPILTRHWQELAVSVPTKSVYARPLEVDDPGTVAQFLARELQLDEKRLQRDLREERGFFWLGRQVSEAAVKKIRERNLRGIYVVDESQRFYPQGTLAAHVVGFVGEGHGLAGIEAKYDRQLRGLAEPLEQEAGGERRGPLVLTIDLRAQELLEKQLAQLQQATSAIGGCALLLAADSGEILALASQPTYDPNFFWEYDVSGRENRVASAHLPAGGFRDLFRLAALSQNGPLGAPDEGSEAAQLTRLKIELKLARLLEQRGEPAARLVRQGERFLSATLAGLAEMEEPRDFAPFLAELGVGQIFTELETETAAGNPGDSFRLSGTELLGGLARLLNPTGVVAPHLLAGVLEGGSGRLQPRSQPLASRLPLESARELRAYFQGLIREGGGIAVLEELTPEAGQVEGGDPGTRNGKEEKRYSTLLVALAEGDKSPAFLLLLALDQALVDPTQVTPMHLAAQKILPRTKGWAAEKPPSVWQPREKKWRAEWQGLQDARLGKSQGGGGVDRQQMPDLQGLSLRKALQVMNHYDLKIRVKGGGRVTGQQPGPGAIITGEECVLVLAGLK